MKFSRRTVAYHEAGHAVARVAVGEPATLTELRPNGGGASHNLPGDMEAWHVIFIALAGPAAQMHAEVLASGLSPADVIAGDVPPGGHADYEKAVAAARTVGNETDAAHIFAEIHGFVREFVSEYWPQIEKVARALMEVGRVEKFDATAV